MWRDALIGAGSAELDSGARDPEPGTGNPGKRRSFARLRAWLTACGERWLPWSRLKPLLQKSAATSIPWGIRIGWGEQSEPQRSP